MEKKRTVRVAVGVVCLIVVSLVMGWFVGQHIPGKPRIPRQSVAMESPIGIPAARIIQTDFGKTAALSGVIQGLKYFQTEEELAMIEDLESYISAYQESGSWEKEYPPITLTIKETRVVSSQSFAAWYPQYNVRGKVFEESNLILVTALITNESGDPIEGSMASYIQRALPMLTLWSDSLTSPGDDLRTGLPLDAEAFLMLNKETTTSSTDVYIDAGHEQELVLPFVLAKSSFKDAAAFDDLDLSRFCIQTPDYATATLYRFYLA